MKTPLQKILVIEEERPLAQALSLQLTENGYEVTIVHTEEDGLEKMEDVDYELIVLSLTLPGINSLEAVKQIKRRDDKIPIVALSGRGQEEKNVPKMYAIGVENCFVKGNTPISDIIEHIRSCLDSGK